jgi:fatty-acyl-CoA synthase
MRSLTPEDSCEPEGTELGLMSTFTLADVIATSLYGSEAEASAVAVRSETTSLTYRQLNARANRLAAGLDAHGVSVGMRVGVLMHNRTEWVEVFFAVARLGAIIVPLNHLLTGHEAAYIIEDSGSSWLIAEDTLWGTVAQLPSQVSDRLQLVTVGEARSGALLYDEIFAEDEMTVRPDVSPEDIFLLQYTSGTTGFPKGAVHTHSTVLWNAVSQRPHFGLGRDTVYLCLPALSWVAGFHSLHLETLWSGGTVVLHPSNSSFDPARFCDLVAQHRVTTVALVPGVLRRVLALDDFAEWDLSSLRLAIVGGEAVPISLLEEINERLPHVSVVQVYGMSEFPSLVTLLEADQAQAKLGSAGRANCASQVRIVDEHDRDRAPREVGEILTRSPATMIGYHGQPEATEIALRNGWFHTGDLGYLDEDGYLFITGRSKELIISAGLNIYPAEIEQALMRHDAVAEAAVIGLQDDKWGEIPKAVVVLREGQTATERELREFATRYLARYKIPKSWEVRSEPLPRTASGKIQKFRLQPRGNLN